MKMRLAFLAVVGLALLAFRGAELRATGGDRARPAKPALLAPAPPHAVPSRKDGGPAQRLDWERQRLADPVTGRIPTNIHRREQVFAAGLPQRAPDKLGGWNFRGPWNIGGRTRALAIDVSDLSYQTLLAGGISGGMWRTNDGGGSWVLTTGSSQLQAVSAVAQDTRPGQQNIWYYGTGEIRGNSASGGGGASYRGDGIFKSLDGGVSWSVLPVTSSGVPTSFSGEWQYVNRIAVDPSEVINDEVYAAVFGFIERSVDGGATWTRVLGQATRQSRYSDVVVASNGVAYASLSSDGAVHGIFRSLDGLAWTNITPPILTAYSRTVLALAPSDESILYVMDSDHNGTTSEGLFKYQYLSGDGSGAGGLWSDRSTQLSWVPGPNGDEPMESYGSYCQSLTVNPTDPNTIYVGGVHLLRSTDGYATNNQDTWIGGWLYTNHHADQHWLVFEPGSSAVAYTASDGGVHKTTNIGAATVNWTSLSNGYNTSQFYAVAVDENLPGNGVLIGGMQDNGTWFTANSNGAAPWSEIFGGDGSYCAVIDASGVVGSYIVSVQTGVIYRMTVDNTTGAWTTWTRVDPTGAGNALFINPLAINPNNPNELYMASANGVWRNSDVQAVPLWSNATTSVNWAHLTDNSSGNVTALAITRGAASTLYYGTSNGRMYRLDNANTAGALSVPLTQNMGAFWPSGAYVSGIAIDPQDPLQLLVAVSNYNVSSLFTSADGGATWTAVEGNLAGLAGPSVRDVEIVPVGAGQLYFAATSTGLYSTSVLAGAATVWVLEAPGKMGNVVVDQLTSRAADRLVVAGTHGKGVFSVTIPASSPVQDNLPQSQLVLQQNVPNPFNPLTQIAFDLPRTGQTRLVVYDVAGHLVRSLVDDVLSAGNHTVNWDGTDDTGRAVSAGVYLYRLQAGDLTEVRRLSLVR